MKTSNILFTLAACMLATCGHATGAPVVVLSQGFDDVGTLGGWLLVNHSHPEGQAWFQGNPGIFGAHAGAESSYIGANYLSASNGAGLVDNWLITPLLSLAGPAQLSFYTRGSGEDGFHDGLEVRFSAGGTDPASFGSALLSVGGPPAAYPDVWQQYSAGVGAGAGRFAFRYTGAAPLSNYIGIDSVVVTVVPEPATYAMTGVGLALLLLLRRGGRRAAGAAGASLALATLALAPAAGAAEEPQGMVVVRDAVTGALRAPTAAEFKALQAAAPVPAPPGLAAAPPQLERKADGTRRAHLGDRGTVYTVIRRDANGATQTQCVHGAEAAAAAALNQSAATDAEEHRHEAD